jgi:hypothetical protein
MLNINVVAGAGAAMRYISDSTNLIRLLATRLHNIGNRDFSKASLRPEL